MTKAAVAKNWGGLLHTWPDGTLQSKAYPGPYTNAFGSTQNPLADFLGGLTDHGDFADMQSASGLAYATSVIDPPTVPDYTDSLALLKRSVLRLGVNHYVKTVLNVSGSFSGSLEHEHIGRGKPNMSFIEVLFQRGGTGCQFVYQPGVKGGFTVLDGSGSTPAPAGSAFAAAPANGDVLFTGFYDNLVDSRIEIRTYKALAASPTTFVAGLYLYIPFANAYAIRDGYMPGFGAYVYTPNTPSDFCATSIELGAWGGTAP